MVRIKHCVQWIVISACVVHGAVVADDKPNKLRLHAAFTVESQGVSGLSGLDWCGGRLLSIDDRGDSDIYQIEFHANKARLVKAIKVDIPPRTESPPLLRRLLSFVRGMIGRGTYDWEGISCSNDKISLVSEIDGAVLQLGPAGDTAWRYSGYVPQLQHEGLFGKTSIGVEALTLVNETTFLLGHERSPPALIELDTTPKVVSVLDLSDEPETVRQQSESPDITGMDSDGELLYTLHRNAMLVCVRTIDTYQVLDCKSYRDTERSTDYLYDNMRFGRAEGIAVKDTYIYLVMDNNGDARVSDGSRQPLFFVFFNPWNEIDRRNEN